MLGVRTDQESRCERGEPLISLSRASNLQCDGTVLLGIKFNVIVDLDCGIQHHYWNHNTLYRHSLHTTSLN